MNLVSMCHEAQRSTSRSYMPLSESLTIGTIRFDNWKSTACRLERNQVEQGTGCPTGMAYAAYAGFQSQPALAIWAEKSLGTTYEFSRREVADKAPVAIGYAMTEKRAMTKDPRTVEALLQELAPLAGQDARFAAPVRHTEHYGLPGSSCSARGCWCIAASLAGEGHKQSARSSFAAAQRPAIIHEKVGLQRLPFTFRKAK